MQYLFSEKEYAELEFNAVKARCFDSIRVEARCWAEHHCPKHGVLVNSINKINCDINCPFKNLESLTDGVCLAGFLKD